MTDLLSRVAGAYGLELSYTDERGRTVEASPESLRAVLGAFGVETDMPASLEQSLAQAPIQEDTATLDGSPCCFLPDWLTREPVWGVTCQIYSLKSRQSLGIGDFHDLGTLAEIAAREGADFLALSPVHALFWSDPDNYSPYFPSSRIFMNPLYLAVHALEGAGQTSGRDLAQAENPALIDYRQTSEIKKRLLEQAYSDAASRGLPQEFSRFIEEGGGDLRRYALFETISEIMVSEWGGRGWLTWPEALQSPGSEAARRIESAHPERLTFFAWLQWQCAGQLKAAQTRAKAAGMRIGLVTDLAVGVAPDGADTWASRGAVLTGVSVGAPPDRLNEAGQSWGVAPLSPVRLRETDGEGFARIVSAATRHAGAVRIDHALGLNRQYLVPAGFDATEGAYARYPLGGLLRVLERVSNQDRALIIGETLGTIPEGYEALLEAANIHTSRVLYFEREEGIFRQPREYPACAMASLSTHDLPTLAGWWQGADIGARLAAGLIDGGTADMQRSERQKDILRLLDALEAADVFSGAYDATEQLPLPISIACHRFGLRTPCRLFAAQLEDLTGAAEQANLPGTTTEHPNWQRRMEPFLEDLPELASFRGICAAAREERPRQQ